MSKFFDEAVKKSKEGGLGWLASFIILLIVVLLVLIAGCSGPKTYEFQYSVDVRYNDNGRETLVGTTKIKTHNPDGIKFSMSSRLRLKPCLILGEIETVSSTNIACDVKSFTPTVLQYKEVP